MQATAICIAAFLISFFARKRGIVEGLTAVLTFGYAYGILRANLPFAASHFIFDSALVGLYCAELLTRVTPAQAAKEHRLREWLIVVSIMPALLVLLPLQDILVQIVGFRAAVLFLPMVLIGSRLKKDDIARLATGIAVLNLGVLVIAALEFVYGIERFYPQSEVTQIIFRSNDVGLAFFRIPSTFTNSAAYGGTMVLTLPIIFAALTMHRRQRWWQMLCLAGAIAAVLAVFLSASRSAAILLMVTVTAALIEHRKSRWGLWLLGGLGVVAMFVAAMPRLQRFLTLGDLSMVLRRLDGSTSPGLLLDIVSRYPFGNGLGAGGTSLPFFLQDRVSNPVLIENEYARIMLEQGIIGFAVWIGFIVWALSGRSCPHLKGQGMLTIRATLIAAFMIAVTGTGLLTSIPATALLLLSVGWLAAARAPRLVPVRNPRPQANLPPSGVPNAGRQAPMRGSG